MTMICPKCHGSMRSYERNGVTVDQCTDCRGIFLDRGELEHLIDAEARFNTAAAAPPMPPAAQNYPVAQPYPPAPSAPGRPIAQPTPARSPMSDLSTIASMATDYLGKGKSKSSSKKGK
jgi:Zn-finger nucleic acid-binding protein